MNDDEHNYRDRTPKEETGPRKRHCIDTRLLLQYFLRFLLITFREENCIKANNISRDIVQEREVQVLVPLQLCVREHCQKVLNKEIELRRRHEHIVLKLVQRKLNCHDVRDRIVIEPHQVLVQLLERPLFIYSFPQVVRVLALLVGQRLEPGQ